MLIVIIIMKRGENEIRLEIYYLVYVVINDEADKHKQYTGIFYFSKNDEVFNQKWVTFICRKELKPSNFELDFVPTIYPESHIPQSSLLPSASIDIPGK